MIAVVEAAQINWQAWFTMGVIVLVIAALITNRIGTDVAMVGGLTALMLFGVLEPTEAIAGFAHPAVIIVAALFVIAAGLEETGGMEMIAQRLLGRPTSLPRAQLRMMTPVAGMSAFMNNTAIIAVYLPIVNDWGKKLRISPSKLLMPLSYAGILGGVCTLIGTASNITINELFLDELSSNGDAFARYGISEAIHRGREFWWMAIVGVPILITGVAFVVICSRWLLPERKPASEITRDERRYTVEMMVQPGSPIVGKTIEEAGLRHLPGLFLSEIERDGARVPAVSPTERLHADDRLLFVGIVESVVDLRKIRGLTPATDQVEKVEVSGRTRQLVEAVVSHNSELLDRTVRETHFRTTHNAAIIAVHRNGQRIDRKIGDIRLQAGDTLLLVTHQGFVQAHRNSGDFYLVSQVEGAREIRHERAWLSIGILVLLVGLIASGLLKPIVAAFLCAMLMIGTRCVPGHVARSSIRWQVLVVIGAAIGIGTAMRTTNADQFIASIMLDLTRDLGPHGVLFVVMVLTSVFAQLITNNGAAVLMFPIVMAAAADLQVSPVPFVLAMIPAVGCNLMTPMAYQTNLMVFGPGGYRFLDYTRMGLPLTILIAIITTIIAPLVYPFNPVVG